MAKPGKPYKPTASEKEFVRYACMAGTSVASIAESLNISPETLRKHFKGDLLTARAKMIHAATKTIYEAAEDGNVDAAKFILARAAKWTEKTEMDLTNSDGALTQPRRIIIEAAPLRPTPALPEPEPDSDPGAAQ
jgi:AcrR family transcriptional regulator